MKVQCRRRSCDHERNDTPVKTRLWENTLPFNVNPRGMLIHRVRIGATHSASWGDHDSVTYWCNNSAVGEGVDLTDDPPKNRLLCSHCEALAVAAGEPTAKQLTGRHIHIGVMKPVRMCCRHEEN